jgi:hypothetical protein
MGNGGFEQLVYCDVPMPELDAGEVLVKVLAAGVNNTEINTRIGWYSGGGWHIPTRLSKAPIAAGWSLRLQTQAMLTCLNSACSFAHACGHTVLTTWSTFGWDLISMVHLHSM